MFWGGGKEDEAAAAMLKSACPDPDLCMIFGTQDEEMTALWQNFEDLTHLHECKPIGKASINGFVLMCSFLRNNYKSSAVLKSSANAEADNMMYEFRVGLFLNKKMKQFPNFLKTYHAFGYNNETAWRDVKALHGKKDTVSGELMRAKLSPIGFDMDHGCRNTPTSKAKKPKTKKPQGKHVAVLVQNLPTPVDFFELEKKSKSYKPSPPGEASFDTLEFIGNMLPIYFQVYFVLHALRKKFTHYDLHTGNVLLYEPEKEHFIEFMYHLKDKSVVQFKSKYICKIIDYGRSYFADDDTSSLELIQSLKPSCIGLWRGNCGYHINSSERNESHDLRLLADSRDRIMKELIRVETEFASVGTEFEEKNSQELTAVGTEFEELTGVGTEKENSRIDVAVAPTLKFLRHEVVYEEEYGTPPAESCLQPYEAICTLADARALIDIAIKNHAKVSNFCFAHLKQLGTLHIYEEDNEPFLWVPAKATADELPTV